MGNRHIIAGIIAITMAGCGAQPPVSGNANGGMLDLGLAYPHNQMMAAADKHCQQYGKTARITKGRSNQDTTGLFECV